MNIDSVLAQSHCDVDSVLVSNVNGQPAGSPGSRSSLPNKMMSGAIAGLAEVSLNYPIIAAKNLVQAEGRLPSLSFNTLPRFYKGFGTAICGVVPFKTTMLTSNVLIRNQMAKQSPDGLSAKQAIMAAAMAGCIGSAVTCPFDVVTTQQQIAPQKRLGQVFKEVSRQGWQGGFYRGARAQITRDMVYATGVLGASELVAARLPDSIKQHDLGASIIGGAVAGVGAGVVSQPLDLVKTRQQASNMEKTTPSAWECVKSIYKIDGLKGLWKGVGFRTLRIGLGAGILLGVRDFVDRRLADSDEN